MATLLRALPIPSEPRSVTPLPGVSWALPERVTRPGRAGPRRKRGRKGSVMGTRKAITDARTRAFTAPPGREAVLWDGIVSGLGLRVRLNGRKTWIVHRRIGNTVVKRTLSALDAISIEDARRAACALIAEARGVGRRADWTPIGALTSCFLLTHRGQHHALS